MAEPWIRVHALLRSKSVTFRAMEALGLKRPAAIGHLVMFWSGVSMCATNGQVGDCTDAQIEEWACWEGKRGEFANFIRLNHLDADGRVREWDDYAGILEHRRERDRERQRDRRERLRADARVTSNGHPRDVTATSVPTIRNDTKRDELQDQLPSHEPAKKPRARVPAGAKANPSWVATFGDWWLANVGAVAYGQVGRTLKPLHDRVGTDKLMAGAAVYADAIEGPPRKTFADFAATAAKWIDLAQQRPVDEKGELTERGRRIMGENGRPHGTR